MIEEYQLIVEHKVTGDVICDETLRAPIDAMPVVISVALRDIQKRIDLYDATHPKVGKPNQQKSQPPAGKYLNIRTGEEITL